MLSVQSLIPTTYVVSSIPHPHHLRCQLDPSSPPRTVSVRSLIPNTYVVSSIPHPYHLRCQLDPSSPPLTLSARSLISTTYVVSSIPHPHHLPLSFGYCVVCSSSMYPSDYLPLVSSSYSYGMSIVDLTVTIS
jgi:hypothetical protein